MHLNSLMDFHALIAHFSLAMNMVAIVWIYNIQFIYQFIYWTDTSCIYPQIELLFLWISKYLLAFFVYIIKEGKYFFH